MTKKGEVLWEAKPVKQAEIADKAEVALITINSMAQTQGNKREEDRLEEHFVVCLLAINHLLLLATICNIQNQTNHHHRLLAPESKALPVITRWVMAHKPVRCPGCAGEVEQRK